MAAWDRTVKQLETQLGRSPTSEELADAMNVPRSKLGVIQRTMAATRSVPTGKHTEEDGATGTVETQPDDLFESGQIIAERSEDMEKMRQLIATFEPMAARVIRMRFGLEGRHPLTLKEAGIEIGLTRERVRQIEQAALERLRDAFRESGIHRSGSMASTRKWAG